MLLRLLHVRVAVVPVVIARVLGGGSNMTSNGVLALLPVGVRCPLRMLLLMSEVVAWMLLLATCIVLRQRAAVTGTWCRCTVRVLVVVRG